MKYQVGDKVFWRSINLDFTGVIEGYNGPFAVVRIVIDQRKLLHQILFMQSLLGRCIGYYV